MTARAAALALLLLPAAAWGCPFCATRGAPGAGTALLVAGLVAVPYALAAAVIKLVRRLER